MFYLVKNVFKISSFLRINAIQNALIRLATIKQIFLMNVLNVILRACNVLVLKIINARNAFKDIHLIKKEIV